MGTAYKNLTVTSDTSWDNLLKMNTGTVYNSNANTSYYFDALINVNGNLDNNTKDEVLAAVRKMFPDISNYVKTDIKKDARMAGHKY